MSSTPKERRGKPCGLLAMGPKAAILKDGKALCPQCGEELELGESIFGPAWFHVVPPEIPPLPKDVEVPKLARI